MTKSFLEVEWIPLTRVNRLNTTPLWLSFTTGDSQQSNHNVNFPRIITVICFDGKSSKSLVPVLFLWCQTQWHHGHLWSLVSLRLPCSGHSILHFSQRQSWSSAAKPLLHGGHSSVDHLIEEINFKVFQSINYWLIRGLMAEVTLGGSQPLLFQNSLHVHFFTNTFGCCLGITALIDPALPPCVTPRLYSYFHMFLQHTPSLSPSWKKV